MKFTKEPPYGLGQLACIINATIDVLNIKVSKLTEASLSQVNNALISIDDEYRSSLKLAYQWLQLVDTFERKGFDEKTKEKILELAEKKYKHLNLKKELK